MCSSGGRKAATRHDAGGRRADRAGARARGRCAAPRRGGRAEWKPLGALGERARRMARSRGAARSSRTCSTTRPSRWPPRRCSARCRRRAGVVEGRAAPDRAVPGAHRAALRRDGRRSPAGRILMRRSACRWSTATRRTPRSAAFLDHVEASRELPKLVMLPLIARDGPFAAALARVLARRGGHDRGFGEHARALLAPDSDRATYLDPRRAQEAEGAAPPAPPAAREGRGSSS